MATNWGIEGGDFCGKIININLNYINKVPIYGYLLGTRKWVSHSLKNILILIFIIIITLIKKSYNFSVNDCNENGVGATVMPRYRSNFGNFMGSVVSSGQQKFVLNFKAHNVELWPKSYRLRCVWSKSVMVGQRAIFSQNLTNVIPGFHLAA